jgi:peptidoglycan/LPS O-acetylase OafA/YrhL
VIFNLTTIGAALLFPLALRLRDAPKLIAIPIRAIAKQSYALYLMHLTILVDLAQALWLRKMISTPTAIIIAVVAPFVLSYLSYCFFESPLLRMRPKQHLRPYTMPSAFPLPDDRSSGPNLTLGTLD